MRVCPGKDDEPCGRDIGPDKRRRYCHACAAPRIDTSKAARAARRQGLPEPPRIGYLSPTPHPSGAGPQRAVQPLREAYAARLEAMGRERSPEGLLVLWLAEQLDGGLAGTAAAGITGRLMAEWAEATAGAPLEPDALDELASKRRDRYGGAG